ncbi:MAG: helix-turn-helix domain-containing protein [Syntrophorhabdales bacterium]|jgi:DNA-binding transcriptional MerR regulator
MSYNSELPSRTFLKPSEVASFFNVAPKTVYFWHRMGRIEGIKIGGSLRIYTSSLVRILGDCVL